MKRAYEISDTANLPYLQAIVKETLRLHPAGPMVVWESTEECTVNGYTIPAKTRLFVNVWAINRDPTHWENPLEFQPERFLAEEGSGKSPLDVRGQHFHFLPFCPGTTLSLQVVQATVRGGVSVNMEEAPGITVPRAHPLVCVPVARLSPFPAT
ncbi:hypothetical protein PRUPE_7G072000 [Prunus persica]|uniref:Cytochrome P450 n=1 Tax=Prunus persica TaxID=3760 RepID=M5VS92_PRUPE|nr:hypothetical protein PRUPE_7G072000 [Prunus persica]